MRTIYEEEVYGYINQFGAVLESQLLEITGYTYPRLRRILNNLMKEELISRGGPKKAFYVRKSGSENVDLHCVDCLWVMIANADKDSIKTAYRGKGAMKISYMSRKKRGQYHIVYINGKKDYLWIDYMNDRYAEGLDESTKDQFRFMFVSESENLLKNLPLERFKFPYICILIQYGHYGREKAPFLATVSNEESE